MADEEKRKGTRWERWKSYVIYVFCVAVFTLRMLDVPVTYAIWGFVAYALYRCVILAWKGFESKKDFAAVLLSLGAAVLAYLDLPPQYYVGSIMAVLLVAWWKSSDILAVQREPADAGKIMPGQGLTTDREVVAKTDAQKEREEERAEQSGLPEGAHRHEDSEDKERERGGPMPVHHDAPISRGGT